MKRTFVCASSCIKHYVHHSYGYRGTPIVAHMCVYTERKNYLIHKIYTQKKYWNNKEKHLKYEQKVGMLLQKRTDTRGVGISSMRKSIYLLTTTPNIQIHRFHPHPLATPIYSTHSPQLSSIIQSSKYG